MTTAARPLAASSAGSGNWIAPIVFAILQILTSILPLFGIGAPIGSQSDAVRTLITPAGWAFSIWGALYTGSLVFAVFQALPAQRRNHLLDQVRLPAAGAFAGNAVWALYTQLFGLSAISVVIIAFTLVCLLTAYRRFVAWSQPFAAGERWCAVLPLTALASWLTVATTVNIAASLRFHGVEGGAATPVISAAVLVIAGLIGAAALFRGRGCPPYAIVFLWAVTAIYAAGGQQASVVALAALLAAAVIAAAGIIGLRRGGARHWFG